MREEQDAEIDEVPSLGSTDESEEEGGTITKIAPPITTAQCRLLGGRARRLLLRNK
jgi:hypothetical protein